VGKIQITQTRVVAELEQTFDDAPDFLEQFAQIAMRDARDWMRGDQHTESEYNATVDGDIHSITIQHTPAAIAHPPISVEEAKAALKQAQLAERNDGEVPVKETW
jgi:hypothetical protein